MPQASPLRKPAAAGADAAKPNTAHAEHIFIASDEASFITGHILNVDGGHTANFSR